MSPFRPESAARALLKHNPYSASDADPLVRLKWLIFEREKLRTEIGHIEMWMRIEVRSMTIRETDERIANLIEGLADEMFGSYLDTRAEIYKFAPAE